MAHIARVIVRFDYDRFSSAFLNARGTALNILDDVPRDWWGNIGLSQDSVAAHAKKSIPDQLYREVSIDILSVNGSIEYISHPLNEENIVINEDFVSSCRIMQRTIETYEEWSIKRAGIRLFYVTSIREGEENLVQCFKGRLKNQFLNVFESSIGDINDLAYTFEGAGADEVSYRVAMGPLMEKNVKQVLVPRGQITDTASYMDKGYNTIVDVDLYENNISFKGLDVDKWCKLKIEKSKQLMDKLSEAFKGE
jgi:hypothetical protein